MLEYLYTFYNADWFGGNDWPCIRKMRLQNELYITMRQRSLDAVGSSL
jgi:hypothetical protein